METEVLTEQGLADETKALVVAQDGYLIECDGDYEMAAEILKGYSGQIKKIDEWFKDLIAKANAAHKELTGRRAQALVPIKEAKQALGAQMGTYQAKMKAQAEAEAEAMRAIQEQEAKEELEKQADAFEEAGQGDAADVLREQAEKVQVPMKVEKLAPHVEGTRTRTIWEYEITDEAAIPSTFFLLDLKAIAAVVKSQKGATNIPGVRVFSREQVS